MSKILIIHIVVFLLHGSDVFAQGSEAMIRNDYHEIGIRSDGQFFETKDGSPAYELVDFPNNHMLDFSGMWVVAKKSDGTKVGFISRENSKSELRSGPIDTLFNKAIDDPSAWDHVWNLDQDAIKTHKRNWSENSYTAPWSIQNWPARHSQNYIPTIMAPFVDWDKDQKYDPTNGDYPYFKGDKMLYFIANDEGQEHGLSGSASMTLEIQGQVYMYNTTSSNVVFARIFVINRSDLDYDSLFFGQYNHFALGNTLDNYVASNVKSNAVYGYNGDQNDEGGFGKNLPYTTCVFLNHPLTSSLAFQSTDSIRKFPENMNEIWNVATGNWRTGDRLEYSGKGYNSSNKFGKYAYPHATDPSHSNVVWTDKDSKDGVGERNIIGFTGPYKLKNNQVLKFDIAFISGLMTDSISHTSIASEIETVKRTYQQLLGVQDNVRSAAIRTTYPNPVNKGEHTIFKCTEPTVVTVYDQTGRLIISRSYTIGKQSMQVPAIPGIYILQFETDQNKSHLRLLVQ
jgi:hypothetical protein